MGEGERRLLEWNLEKEWERRRYEVGWKARGKDAGTPLGLINYWGKRKRED